MKKVLIIVLLISGKAFSQKISPYNYKNVDTLNKYKNAETIKYKDKFGKSKIDTIYFNKLKTVINIESVDVMNIYDKKLNQ